jgi:hypothetical protein
MVNSTGVLRKFIISSSCCFGIKFSIETINDLPNEQVKETFCVCKGPEFGCMVQCDNENCEIVWFQVFETETGTKRKMALSPVYITIIMG